MNIAVMVTGAPYTAQASASALQFCRAAAARGHNLSRIFFYQDGVQNGTRLSVPPQDEDNLIEGWVELAGKSGVELSVCVAASQRRGVLDQGEARREGLDDDNLHPAFTIAGLGVLMESIIEADRFISFGT